jgi:hypothetical protein
MLEVAPKTRITVLPRTPERVEVEGVNTSDAVYECLGFPLATSSGNKILFKPSYFVSLLKNQSTFKAYFKKKYEGFF